MAARELCGEASSDEESVFNLWARINRPDLLSDRGLKLFEKHMPINGLHYIKTAPKPEFFEFCLKGVSAARL